MADSPHSGESVPFDLLLERCDGDVKKAASVLSDAAGIHPRAARDLVERAPTRLVLGIPRAEAERIAAAVEKEGLRAEPVAGEGRSEGAGAKTTPSGASSGSFRRYRRSGGDEPAATPAPADPPSGRFGRPGANDDPNVRPAGGETPAPLPPRAKEDRPRGIATSSSEDSGRGAGAGGDAPNAAVAFDRTVPEERPRRGTDSNRAPPFASTVQAEPEQKSIRTNRKTAFEKTLPADAMAEAAAQAANAAPAFDKTVEAAGHPASESAAAEAPGGREAGADWNALLAARDEALAKAEATGSHRARPNAGVATERTVPAVGGGRRLVLQVAVILGLAIAAGAAIGAYFALGG